VNPDRWWIVTVRTSAPWDAELLPSCLLEAGARAVVEDGEGVFTAPFEPPEDPEGEAHRLRDWLTSETGLDDVEVAWRWQPHEDWESLWRRGIVPRQVSSRVMVAPSWDVPSTESGSVVVVLDPGMAFGTAEHPTTRGCIRLLDGLVTPGERVADIGSGSGILAVAAALLGAREVRALESDPWAVEAAAANVVRNGVAHRVRVEEALVDLPLLAGLGVFHGILANIERGIVVPLLPGLVRALEPGGWLILSGIPRPEAHLVVEEAVRAGLLPAAEDPEEEWWSGSFRRGGARAP
jgi:ribosomal protein L11 methyltransferase